MTYIRRIIISGSDVDTTTALLNANPKFSASLYATSSHESPDLIYYDIEYPSAEFYPSIYKNISTNITYVKNDTYIQIP